MMLYRYELYADGEYQDVGIFQGMEGIFSDDRVKGLIFPFDRNLPKPPYHSFDNFDTLAFFTEKGKHKFEKEIETIVKAYERQTCFEVRTLIIEESQIQHDVLYQDEYQVIVKENKESGIRRILPLG